MPTVALCGGGGRCPEDGAWVPVMGRDLGLSLELGCSLPGRLLLRALSWNLHPLRYVTWGSCEPAWRGLLLSGVHAGRHLGRQLLGHHPPERQAACRLASLFAQPGFISGEVRI